MACVAWLLLLALSAAPAAGAPLSFDATVLSLGPDAYWQFDSADPAADASGNAHTLSIAASSAQVAVVGSGIGVGAFLSGDEAISVDVTHTSTTARTVLGWFCVGISFSGASDKKTVVYTGSTEAYRRNQREFEFTIYGDGSARLVATAVGPGGAQHSRIIRAPAGTITPGDAHFFAAVINLDPSVRTTAGLELFIDGTSMGKEGFKGQDEAIYDSSALMTIGEGLVEDHGFDGAVDEIAVLPAALTAAEVQELYNLVVPGTSCAAVVPTTTTIPTTTTVPSTTTFAQCAGRVTYFAEDFNSGYGQFLLESAPGGINELKMSTDGGTPSSGTGPECPASTCPNPSLGDEFVFLEGSSAQLGETHCMNATVDLTLATTPIDLNFDYYMFGSSIGTLNVSVNTAQVFSASGQIQTGQYEAWSSGQVNLNSYIGETVTLQVCMDESTGSYQSDAAIDNISVCGPSLD